MGSFYATLCTTDCLQMLYEVAKTEFHYRIMLNHWKIHSRSDSQNAINSICCPTNDGERPTEHANDVFHDVTTSFVSSPFADARTCL